MEHTTEGLQTHTRHNFDANITSQDLIDSYLAPFQVRAAGRATELSRLLVLSGVC